MKGSDGVNPRPHGNRSVHDEAQAGADDEDRTAPGVKPGASVGFRAKLAGVSLWDLVQMECLAGARKVVRVTGEAGIGYLYFDRGQIVHAVTAARSGHQLAGHEVAGQEAALEILGWTNGSFQPCDRPWPEVAAIVTSHEALLLEAARRRDERERAATNLVSFPRAGRASPITEELEGLEPMDIEEEGATAMGGWDIDDVPPRSAGQRGDAGSGGDFQLMLRLGAGGAVVRSHGASEEQAEAIAYVKRLVDLTGELMGLPELTALELVFARGRCVMFTDSNGDTVVLRPAPDTDVQPIRDRLGL
jgi:hypothetical protein